VECVDVQNSVWVRTLLPYSQPKGLLILNQKDYSTKTFCLIPIYFPSFLKQLYTKVSDAPYKTITYKTSDYMCGNRPGGNNQLRLYILFVKD
jgi:hypothetical protein